MNILIIGGSRFVGPLVVSKLLKKDHSLTLFNRGKIKSQYEKNIKFIQGNRNEGFNLKEHFDCIIDTCAFKSSHIQTAISQLNFDYYLNFGTAASYKKSEIFPLKESSPLGDWPIWGDYNKGKVECENILKDNKIKHSTIRPVYILGSNNYVDREKFIYSMIKNNTQIILPGNGQALIQFINAQDVSNSIL